MHCRSDSEHEVDIEQRSFVLKLVGRAYCAVFHEEMGAEARAFLSSLLYVVAGTGVATLMTFGFGVLGGRILGPSEYGKFSLVQSAADFLSLPMLLGFGVSMVKFASEKPDAVRQASIIKTAYSLIIISTTVSLAAVLVLSRQLSSLLSMTPALFYSGVVLAVFYVFYNTGSSLQRGLSRMRSYAVFQPIYGVILLGGFLLFATLHTQSFRTMLYPSMIAYGLTGAMVMVLMGRKYIGLGFNREWVMALSSYSFFAVVTALSSSLYTNVGKILIGRYMSVADVGVYSAYFSPSLNVAGLFFLTFNVVFFPTASRYSNKAAVFDKIGRSLPYLVALGTPFVFLLEFVILKLYGGEYPVNFLLMLLFAITSVLIVWYDVLAATFNSEGLKGVRLTTLSVMAVAGVDILFSLVMIPRIGLFGAIGGLGLGFASGVVVLSLLRRRLYPTASENRIG